MGKETTDDWDTHFDTEDGGKGADEGSSTTNAGPASEDQEPAHPDVTTIAQLIEDALTPLRESIETMTEAYAEEPRGYDRLSKLLNESSNSIHQEIQECLKETSSDPDYQYNISAFQFQAAMLQPCNGQILPAAVRDEIDRLYQVEKAYKIAERAERVLKILIGNDPILLKLPDNPDDRMILMSVMNRWYTQAYPGRSPLKLSSGGVPD